VGQMAEHGDQVVGLGNPEAQNRELVVGIVVRYFFDDAFKTDRLKSVMWFRGHVQSVCIRADLEFSMVTPACFVVDIGCGRLRGWPSFDFGQNPIRCIGKIFGHEIDEKAAASEIAEGFHAIAGFDQHRCSASGISSACHICGAVTDHNGLFNVNAVLVAGLPNQPGLRFAAATPFIRPVRAKEDIGDVPAVFGDDGAHFSVHVEEGLHQFAVDRRLIGDDNGGEPGGRETTQGIEATRQEIELAPILDVGGRIPVDDAVAVQEYDLVRRKRWFQRAAVIRIG
jgi:hypothetical protein